MLWRDLVLMAPKDALRGAGRASRYGLRWTITSALESASQSRISLQDQQRGVWMRDIEQAVRERAYYLWIEGGRKHGDADAHWFAAARKIPNATPSWLPTRAR